MYKKMLCPANHNNNMFVYIKKNTVIIANYPIINNPTLYYSYMKSDIVNMKNEHRIKQLERTLIDSPNDASAHFELGMLYSQNERFRMAILELEKAILLKLGNFKAIYELGLIYSRNGQYQEAIRQWRKLTDEDGDVIFDHLKLDSSENIMPAVRKWERFRDSQKTSAYKDFTLGFANLIMGRWDRAILDFKEAIASNPKLEAANYYKGLCHLQKGEYKVAASNFLTELSIRPKHASTLYHLGLAYNEIGNISKAIDQFHRALKEMPEYIKAQFQLGKAFLNQGNYARAVEIFKKVLELNPRFVEAYFELGQVYEKQYLMDKAITQYELAIHLDPDYKEANFRLGLLYKNFGKPDSALEYLKKTVELDPEEGDAHYYMGIIYLQRNDYTNAIDKFKKAIEIMPGHSYAHYSLGLSYFKVGKLDEAIEEYKKSLELNPRDTQVQNTLGQAYLEAGDYEKATGHFNSVLSTNPGDIQAYYNLARVHFKFRNYNKAITAFQEVSKLDESDNYRLFNKSIELIREDRFEEAIEELDKAGEDSPETRQDLSLKANMLLLATSALEQAQKNYKYRESYEKLDLSVESFIFLLSDVVDKRIPGKDGHSRRVGEISAIVAPQLNFSEEETQLIRMLGMLHDVGKILVPEYVLASDPGKITAEENRLLRSHPSTGFEILRQVPIFGEKADYVLYHHERYDGKGYPEGIRGDEIPPGAQIICIADYWDNLVRLKKFSPASALDHMLGLRYKKFSSEVLNCFLTVVDDLLLL